MKKLRLNSEIILDKEFDVDIKGYNAKQVDTFLDEVCEDYRVFENIINDYQEYIKELQFENERIREELDNTIKNQTITNEMVQTEQINTIDILKRLSKLEQEVYNQK